LLIVILAIFAIGVVGFVTIPSQESVVEVAPGPTIQEKVAIPTAVATPLPTSALSSEEVTPSAQRFEAMISNLSFQPTSITVGRGSTVVWRNQDTVVHTVIAEDGSFSSGTIVAGDTFEQRFDKVKTYAYSCGIYPEMKGTIFVK